jgi:tRNA G18 (ribose-2'-O)-methylase SpoU
MKRRTYDELMELRAKAEESSHWQRHPVSVVLDNIRSMYNVGSIFRTADAAAAQLVVLAGFTPRPPRKEIAKTALGATETVPWDQYDDPVEAVLKLKQAGYTVLAVEIAEGSLTVDALEEHHYPLALVFGNEVHGVSDAVLAACDGAVEIPMYGAKHSLNVAVSAGVAILGAVERWRQIARR